MVPISFLFTRPRIGKAFDYSLIKIDANKIKKGKQEGRNYLVKNVIMHELGHALGLTHFNRTDPLMDAHAGDCNGTCPILNAVFEEFLRPYLSKEVYGQLLRDPENGILI